MLPPMSRVRLPGGSESPTSLRPSVPSGNTYERDLVLMDGASPFPSDFVMSGKGYRTVDSRINGRDVEASFSQFLFKSRESGLIVNLTSQISIH